MSTQYTIGAIMRWTALILFSFPLLGADGDAVGPQRDTDSQRVQAVYLCDSSVAADQGTNCDMFRSLRDGVDEYHFFIRNATGCDPTLSVNIDTFFEQTGADAFTVCTLTDANRTCTLIRDRDGALNKFFRVALTNVANCTDLDVIGEFYNYRVD